MPFSVSPDVASRKLSCIYLYSDLAIFTMKIICLMAYILVCRELGDEKLALEYVNAALKLDQRDIKVKAFFHSTKLLRQIGL